MRLTEVQFPSGGARPVDGYGPGFFRIGGQVHEGGVTVSALGVTAWAGLDDPAPLLALASHADILLIGMGADIAPLPRPLLDALDRHGLMTEPMSSPAAARSYNVLLAEGRRVACALMPV
ncbi:MAG: Mth938-like domain-containing protein [Paracoccus sp. (in: a-proteobacteria)]|nr:Mth938-like domain-containing protein [Paracoccus sp. (in: a-proteobacteria)]